MIRSLNSASFNSTFELSAALDRKASRVPTAGPPSGKPARRRRRKRVLYHRVGIALSALALSIVLVFHLVRALAWPAPAPLPSSLAVLLVGRTEELGPVHSIPGATQVAIISGGGIHMAPGPGVHRIVADAHEFDPRYDETWPSRRWHIAFAFLRERHTDGALTDDCFVVVSMADSTTSIKVARRWFSSTYRAQASDRVWIRVTAAEWLARDGFVPSCSDPGVSSLLEAKSVVDDDIVAGPAAAVIRFLSAVSDRLVADTHCKERDAFNAVAWSLPPNAVRLMNT
ncbi:Uncharacterized protein PBTT_00222 [Plasmodiophora brassicae]|uniref:Uncharacterized protein n=1 Tax=Plasmodiophora brassicae TaxID=37360 RepID=A0A0G4J3X0_PLABS|nr:hypothetical protein PBRA_002515 [Plasmodiophora brassicae]SPQ93570.1 unnamed protein product [Plasmodiophora brassicae]